MVQWYEEAKTESQRVRAGKSAIQSNSESLYDELWNEIKLHIKDLKTDHGLEVRTNGSQFDRIVYTLAERNLVMMKDREVHIKLEQDMITAIGTGISLNFPIAAGDDEVVRLTYEGQNKTKQAAAVMILRRLLFSELYPEDEFLARMGGSGK